MTPRCSYAACSQSPVGRADDWEFCGKHLRLHQIEKVGAPATRPGPRPKGHPHGSAEAYRRHVRAGEKACADCLRGRWAQREQMLARPA